MTAVEPKTVYTFCRYCLAACGVAVTVDGNRVAKISADKANPHSWQDFCAKGRTAHQVVEHPRRILNPMRRVGDSYVDSSWDVAIADIMFCDETWRRTLERELGLAVQWIFFENDADQCLQNCRHRHQSRPPC